MSRQEALVAYFESATGWCYALVGYRGRDWSVGVSLPRPADGVELGRAQLWPKPELPIADAMRFAGRSNLRRYEPASPPEWLRPETPLGSRNLNRIFGVSKQVIINSRSGRYWRSAAGLTDVDSEGRLIALRGDVGLRFLPVPPEETVRSTTTSPTAGAPGLASAMVLPKAAAASAGDPRARFERALLADDPAAEIRAALDAGWLDELIPELRAEMDIPQRTRWHALSVLEHSLATMAAMPACLDERLAGLFHDIGKRRTTTIRDDGDEQYLGHADVGAGMTARIMLRVGFELPLAERVAELVRRHMDLHAAAKNGYSQKAQAKLIGRIGERFEVLARLSLADTGAMNPAIRDEKIAEEKAYHDVLRANPALPPDPAPWSMPPARQRRVPPAELVRDYPRAAKTAAKPVLVVVVGLPASGKSYFARQLAVSIPLTVVSSDSVRMALTGGSPSYSGSESAITHQTVGQIARSSLAESRHTLIDATGVLPRDRARSIAIGKQAGVPTILAWCSADEREASRRLAARAVGADPSDVSQADGAIRRRMAAMAVEPTDDEADTVIHVTPANLEANLAVVPSLLEGEGSGRHPARDPLAHFFWQELTPRAQTVIAEQADEIYQRLASHADWAPLNCDMACRLWVKAFRFAGVPVEIVSGSYWQEDGPAPTSADHVWLSVDGFLVDPTAGQFASDEAKIELRHYHPGG